VKTSLAEKSKTNARIVSRAKELFKSKGIEKTSVAEVMNSSGLTHGGFYRHFEDKTSLIKATIQSSFDEVCDLLSEGFQKKPPTAVVDQYCDLYLSKKHLNNPQYGCPIASLATEISKEGDEFKEIFSAGFEDLIHQLKQGSSGTDKEREGDAIRKMSMMVGAIVIARASNSKNAKKVIDACKGTLHGFTVAEEQVVL
jgi:TetR/AcrR family transcriptional repressor of nem operon